MFNDLAHMFYEEDIFRHVTVRGKSPQQHIDTLTFVCISLWHVQERISSVLQCVSIFTYLCESTHLMQRPVQLVAPAALLDGKDDEEHGGKHQQQRPERAPLLDVLPLAHCVCAIQGNGRRGDSAHRVGATYQCSSLCMPMCVRTHTHNRCAFMHVHAISLRNMRVCVYARMHR